MPRLACITAKDAILRMDGVEPRNPRRANDSRPVGAEVTVINHSDRRN